MRVLTSIAEKKKMARPKKNPDTNQEYLKKLETSVQEMGGDVNEIKKKVNAVDKEVSDFKGFFVDLGIFASTLIFIIGGMSVGALAPIAADKPEAASTLVLFSYFITGVGAVIDAALVDVKKDMNNRKKLE